jgi:hypothetical protein
MLLISCHHHTGNSMYKVVQIWPGQTVTYLHPNSPSRTWTTLYISCGCVVALYSVTEMYNIERWPLHKIPLLSALLLVKVPVSLLSKTLHCHHVSIICDNINCCVVASDALDVCMKFNEYSSAGLEVIKLFEQNDWPHLVDGINHSGLFCCDNYRKGLKQLLNHFLPLHTYHLPHLCL